MVRDVSINPRLYDALLTFSHCGFSTTTLCLEVFAEELWVSPGTVWTTAVPLPSVDIILVLFSFNRTSPAFMMESTCHSSFRPVSPMKASLLSMLIALRSLNVFEEPWRTWSWYEINFICNKMLHAVWKSNHFNFLSTDGWRFHAWKNWLQGGVAVFFIYDWNHVQKVSLLYFPSIPYSSSTSVYVHCASLK